MIQFFNTESIISSKQSVKIAPSGFRYGHIPNLFKEDIYNELIKTFPRVEKFKLVDKMSGGGHKRFYVGPVYSGSDEGCICHLSSLPQIWKEVIIESSSPELIGLFKNSSGVNFNSLVNFGFAYGNEGCVQGPHVDGAVRGDGGEHPSTIATIVYFNEKPEGPGGTCVYATDRKTVLFQAPSLRNGLFFFEQHVDAWHGFPEMPAGSERRIVSLAYGQEKEPVYPKTSLFHRLTCLSNYKRIAKRILR